jgi:hypothetical protein
VILGRSVGGETGGQKFLIGFIHISHAEVVGEARGVTGRLLGLWLHELHRQSRGEFEADESAAIEHEAGAEMLDVERA